MRLTLLTCFRTFQSDLFIVFMLTTTPQVDHPVHEPGFHGVQINHVSAQLDDRHWSTLS